MVIFSLFGKKGNRQATSSDGDSSRAKRQSSTSRSSKQRSSTVKRDAQTALETALKIDAIESEMSSEFINATTTQQPTTGAPPKSVQSVTPAAKPRPLEQNKKPNAHSREIAVPVPPATLHPMDEEFGTTTDFLLHGQTAVSDLATPSVESAAIIEEAAIMYANGQTDLVEQMLRTAIEEGTFDNATRKAWWMMFDLYQITGKQHAFEQLSMEYASKFETSPPAWIDSNQSDTQTNVSSGATPMVPFSGKLDANGAKHIERLQKLAESHRTLRLEFARVSDIDAAGCSLLLGALNKLQKSGHDLILVGAPELANKIRTIIEVGRRDDTEAPWLLLLEILRLLNREEEFEATSIDYCVTFEVSPPPFVAPQIKITTAVAETHNVAATAEDFMMPAVVDGRVDNLIAAITAYSEEHNPAVINCSQLVRIDFNATGHLLTGLTPLCGTDKVIEFHHVNHLIAELLNVMGFERIVRILPRKN